MLNKMRDWLIKRLGGYTVEQYSQILSQRCVIHQEQRYGLIPIKHASVMRGTCNEDDLNFRKRCLLEAIMHSAEHYVSFETEDAGLTDSVILKATLWVADLGKR